MPIARRFKRISAAVLVIVSVGVCGSVLESIYVRRKAEEFLETTRQLMVGSSSYEQAKQSLRRFHGYQFGSGSCPSTNCELQYRFDNLGMRVLRVVPPTGFYFAFGFRNGLLQSKKAILGQGICCAAVVREVEYTASVSTENPGYVVIPNGAPYKVLVALDTRATKEDRQKAYQFNLACLTSLGGCKDAHQLLPSVWK